MKIKNILCYNNQTFIDDIRRVRDILVWKSNTGEFFRIRKKDVISIAETKAISYYISDKVFVVQRDVMIIT